MNRWTRDDRERTQHSTFLSFHRRCSSTSAEACNPIQEWIPSLIPPFRSFAIFVTKRFAILTGPLIIETVCDKLSREERGREGRVRGGGNLVGGFHHRRDGTRRLQDVSDLSIFSTRSTMNVPVSEPLLGQTWIIILTSGVKLPDAICRYSTVFYGGISDVRRVTSGEERRFGKLHAFFMQQTFPRKRNKLKVSG